MKVSLWIARDKDGGVFLYSEKPIRYDTYFFANCIRRRRYFGNLSPIDIKWEDEPREITIEL